MAGQPDPKPVKPYRASADEWKTLRHDCMVNCGWRCVACGEDYAPALSVHHIVGRDQGGADVLENLVVLCGYTEVRPNGCHVVLQEHRNGWERVAAHVRMFVMGRASRTFYVIDNLGVEGFDRMYPVPPFLAIGDLTRYSYPDPMLREGYDT